MAVVTAIAKCKVATSISNETITDQAGNNILEDNVPKQGSYTLEVWVLRSQAACFLRYQDNKAPKAPAGTAPVEPTPLALVVPFPPAHTAAGGCKYPGQNSKLIWMLQGQPVFGCKTRVACVCPISSFRSAWSAACCV